MGQAVDSGTDSFLPRPKLPDMEGRADDRAGLLTKSVAPIMGEWRNAVAWSPSRCRVFLPPRCKISHVLKWGEEATVAASLGGVSRVRDGERERAAKGFVDSIYSVRSINIGL